MTHKDPKAKATSVNRQVVVTPTTSNVEMEDKMFNNRNYDIINRPNGTITSKSANMLKSPDPNMVANSPNDFNNNHALTEKDGDGLQTEEALIYTQRSDHD